MFISLAHWKARSGLLINVKLFSLDVTAVALRAKIHRKSAISLQLGQFYPKFHVEEDVPTNHFRTNNEDNVCLTTLSLTIYNIEGPGARQWYKPFFASFWQQNNDMLQPYTNCHAA